MRFTAASTRDTIYYLGYMLRHHGRVFFSRWGDGEVIATRMEETGHHSPSEALKDELIEALSITDDLYLKAGVINYPIEYGMHLRLFKYRKTEMQKMRQYVADITDDRFFWNAVAFHYLSIHDPMFLRRFVDEYIKPKKKMYIGSNRKEKMEAFYGPIEYYIKTPAMDAYSTIDTWWPVVLEDVDKCSLVLPSVGVASNVVIKRLWNLGVNTHCIDFGSINDALDGRKSRSWIKKIGVRKLRKKLLN